MSRRDLAPYIGPSMAPAWAIIGAPDPHSDGVVLLASTELNQATLTATVDEPDFWDSWSICLEPPIERVRYSVTVGMHKFTLVKAPTYGEALRYLLAGDWDPDNPAADDAPIELTAGGSA